MIGFVTWPPLSHHHYNYKGGQVTKPVIVVKIHYKLLYVIQVVKKIFDKYLASADIKVFGYTSRLMVASRVTTKTAHVMTTKSLLHVAKVSKKWKTKLTFPQLISLPYCCLLTISLPLTTKIKPTPIGTGIQEIWFLRSLHYEKNFLFPLSGLFLSQVVGKLMGAYQDS